MKFTLILPLLPLALVTATSHSGASFQNTTSSSLSQSCRQLALLTSLTNLVNNATLLAEKTNNNATKAALLQAKAAETATQLATLQANATLVAECAAKKEAGSGQGGGGAGDGTMSCEKMAKIAAWDEEMIKEKAGGDAAKEQGLRGMVEKAKEMLASGVCSGCEEVEGLKGVVNGNGTASVGDLKKAKERLAELEAACGGKVEGGKNKEEGSVDGSGGKVVDGGKTEESGSVGGGTTADPGSAADSGATTGGVSSNVTGGNSTTRPITVSGAGNVKAIASLVVALAMGIALL
ncbi:hypothetical protein OQA88_12258 [Cercophora sp. LCS_1]